MSRMQYDNETTNDSVRKIIRILLRKLNIYNDETDLSRLQSIFITARESISPCMSIYKYKDVKRGTKVQYKLYYVAVYNRNKLLNHPNKI